MLKIDEFINGLHGYLGRELEPIFSRLKELEEQSGIRAPSLDDLEVVQESERKIIFRFSRGGSVKEFPISFPVLIDRGVYKADLQYEKGDGVTYGGSFWICQKDRPGSKPGEDSDWRLAVKRGRDAKGEI